MSKLHHYCIKAVSKTVGKKISVDNILGNKYTVLVCPNRHTLYACALF